MPRSFDRSPRSARGLAASRRGSNGCCGCGSDGHRPGTDRGRPPSGGGDDGRAVPAALVALACGFDRRCGDRPRPRRRRDRHCPRRRRRRGTSAAASTGTGVTSGTATGETTGATPVTDDGEGVLVFSSQRDGDFDITSALDYATACCSRQVRPTREGRASPRTDRRSSTTATRAVTSRSTSWIRTAGTSRRVDGQSNTYS